MLLNRLRPRRALALVLLATLAAPAVRADTLRVPKDFATIPDALAAAEAGDQILISKGSYPALTLDGVSELTLRAKGKVFLEAPEIEPEGELSAVALRLENCTDVSITGLRFADTPSTAVAVTGSTGITLSKLRITGTGGFGIQLLDCANVLVSKARIDETFDDGVRTDDCSAITVDKCVIRDTGDDGVSFSSGGGVPTDDSFVMRTKVLRPGDDGVDVNGEGNLVEKVVVRDAEEDGFEVDFDGAGSGNTFRKCRAFDPAEQGFELNGSANTVEACRVLRAGDDAVALRGTGGHTVTDSAMIRPDFDGVFVADDAAGNTISGNKINKPQDDGIDLQADGNMVIDNKVAKAAFNGLEVESTGNTISGNKLKGSGNLDIDDSSGGPNTYTDNKFKTSNL